MNKKPSLVHGLLLSSAAFAAMTSVPSFSQEESMEEIVVTGSRIRRQDYVANSPITTVDRSTFEETSTIGIETVLNQLPQFVPQVTQFDTANVQNSAFDTVGASIVSLRGLGANRSLTLIDGRRAQPVNATLVVDTNTIPAAAIERVEIISGGASAVYGADAVGGVTNFILKDDYEGASIDFRYGLTQEGDNNEYTLSGLFGANLADGRGNVMLGLEHSSREGVKTVDRDWRVDDLNNPNILGTEFWFAETFIANASGEINPFAQDDINDVFSALPDNSVFCGGPVPNNPGAACRYFINPTADGNGTVFTGAGQFFLGQRPGAYKYNAPLERSEYPGVAWRKVHPDGTITENSLDTYQSIPLDRYGSWARGKFDFSENVTGIMQLNFSRSQNKTLLGFPGSALGANGLNVPHGDELWDDSLADTGLYDPVAMIPDPDSPGDMIPNPNYNPDGAWLGTYDPSTGLPDYRPDAPTNPAYLNGGLYGLNCDPTGGCTESEVWPVGDEMEALLAGRGRPGTNDPGPNGDIMINRSLDFFGPRTTETTTTTYQVLVGLEGTLADEFDWDITYSHGETETAVNYGGIVDRERLRAITASPNFGRGFFAQGNNQGAGFAGGEARCTTGMPFIQEFEMSDDCREAVTATLQNNTELVQNMLEANLTGNLFSLPAGDVGFALGTAWRENEYVYRTDSLTTNESFVANALGVFPTSNTTGKFDVKELYGELLIPILADIPIIQALNLEIGARYSDWSTVGGVNTYKVLLDWTFVDWIRLRGGFNKAQRAPNIAELFLARTQQFGGTGGIQGDVCSQNNNAADPAYSANPNVNPDFQRTVDICSEIMGPTGASQYYGTPIADQPSPGQQGLPNTIGNPELDSESAETWTVGFVIRSPFESGPLAGFTASIDYYQIEIEDMIAVSNGDAVFQACLDPTLNPSGDISIQACQSLNRDPISGAPASLDLTYTNEGWAKTSGIDLQLDWTRAFDDMGLDLPGGMAVNLQANFNGDNLTKANENSNEIDWEGTRGCALGMQCMGYDYRLFATFSYFAGPWTAALRWQHWPHINGDGGPLLTDIDRHYNLFALSGSYRFGENYTFRFGIENLLDEEPPLADAIQNQPFVLDKSHVAGGSYDSLGRRMFLNVTMDF